VRTQIVLVRLAVLCVLAAGFRAGHQFSPGPLSKAHSS